MAESNDIDQNADQITNVIEREGKSVIVQWAILGLLAAVATLAGLNARSYIEGIAAEVYKEQGLPPSETKQRLTKIESKLENVEGDVGEVRQDIRALIQSL